MLIKCLLNCVFNTECHEKYSPLNYLTVSKKKRLLVPPSWDDRDIEMILTMWSGYILIFRKINSEQHVTCKYMCLFAELSSVGPLGAYFENRMAWQWAETLVEIRGTLADIRGTTKLGCRWNFPKHEFNRPVCLEAHRYLLAHLSQ